MVRKARWASVPHAIDKVRELAGGMAELLWPTRCAGCDEPGTLLCDDCRSRILEIDQETACPHCGAPFGSLVCTECTDCVGAGREEDVNVRQAEQNAGVLEHFSAIDAMCCYGVHAWPLDSVIRTYKDAGERRLAPLIAGLLEKALLVCHSIDLDEVSAIAFVPATPAAYARRGFDHMQPVAQALSLSLGIPLRDVLARDDVRDQRGLSRGERLSNARGATVTIEDVPGERILLVDDVLTTGATMAQAARVLRRSGASKVFGACVSRAW